MADGTGGDTPDQPDFGDNPFANLPMFAEMAKALSGQGPLNWDAARQFATMAAGGSPFGSSEPNIDPAVRIAMADLARILELHVRDLTGADVTFPEITPVTRTAWAQRTLDAYRPLFTELATSLGRPPAAAPEEDAGDPMMAMMAGLSKMMAPAMMGMAVGSMVGRMAQRTFGQYDLPIPRSDASLLVVPANIDGFATEWSLPVDEMRLWVLAHELAGLTLFSIEHVAGHLRGLVQRHVGGVMDDDAAHGVARIIEVAGHFRLAIDHDRLAGIFLQVNAVHHAVMGDMKAVMNLAFGIHALAHAGLAHQFGKAMFQHAGADARQHMVAAVLFEQHVVDAALV